jgi:hypothetical protein
MDKGIIGLGLIALWLYSDKASPYDVNSDDVKDDKDKWMLAALVIGLYALTVGGLRL